MVILLSVGLLLEWESTHVGDRVHTVFSLFAVRPTKWDTMAVCGGECSARGSW